MLVCVKPTIVVHNFPESFPKQCFIVLEFWYCIVKTLVMEIIYIYKCSTYIL